LPDQKAREKIFQVHLRDRPLDGEVTAQWLAEQTQGFSGAEIEAACHRAMMAAISERIKLTPDNPKTDKLFVCREHLVKAIQDLSGQAKLNRNE
jgi:transitional endoplasmic reticulum ATPase